VGESDDVQVSDAQVSDAHPAVASVRVLGGVHAVATDGSLIDLPSPSQRRLLAILALHAPRRLRSEWLADALDISPGALRTTVSRVRTTVGPGMLETTSSGYALVGAVDASAFCQAVADAADADDRVPALRRALTLWNGPALEEFGGEEWADGEIARLTEIHAGTVDDLADALIEHHRPADAVALLESQISAHPYRDRSRGLVIRALAAEGRQADALRAFQRYRSLLVDELGTEPSPEVVRIERRVATGWDGLDAVGVVSAPALEPTDDAVDIPLPGALARSMPFVGRAEQLDVLASELAVARESGLRCVTFGGEAGIGKTTLLAAFARAIVASARATVVYGRCDETGVSLQPFRTVLAACAEHAPVPILAAHVAVHGGELLRICPSLSTRVATTPAPTESDDATERFLTFEAASDLLRRLAGARPLIVMLDDLQWAEPTALLLLRHLAGALADAPVLLVLSARDPGEQESEDLRVALADLDRHGVRRLHLGGLDADELLDLVSATPSLATVPEPGQLVDTLRTQTAGNPLYASQLIRHWTENRERRDAMPSSLRDVVWRRVRTLGDDATQVLTTASVLGVEFYEDVLIEMMTEHSSTVVRDALDAAERNGLLLLDGGSVRRSLQFVHALVAKALYADIGASRRAHMHGLAAGALEQNVDELPAEVVVQLARHCALADRPAEARQWSIRAGDHALENLAPAEAAQHYRVALDLAIALDRPETERSDLLVRLGDAQHRAGDSAAFETLQEGARLARRSGAHEVLVRATFAYDRGFMLLDSRAPEYLAMVEAALAVTDSGDTATFARLRALLAQCLIYTPDAARRVAAAHEALDLATEVGDPTLFVQTARAALFGLWAPGRRELRTRVAAEAIRAAESVGDPRLAFGAHQSAYLVAVESADHAVAARSLAHLRTAARSLAEPGLRWTVGIYDTFETMMAGRLEEAEALAGANLDLGMQIGETDAFTFFASQVFVIGTFAGRHDELLPLVEQAARDSPGAVFKLSYAIVCAAVGREDVAREILAEGAATRFSEIAVDNIWMTSVLGYAVLAIELGDDAAAAQLLPVIEPFVADVAFNGVTSQGPVAAYAGKLASLLGQHELAEQHLLTALDIATAFGWTYHRATTLFALAQNRYRERDTLDDAGRAWLGEASALCRDHGFRSWAKQIDALAQLNAR
jgi:DNA-binding SARP family transcriptional activator/tetratricopeptide (TPR) repeat protein